MLRLLVNKNYDWIEHLDRVVTVMHVDVTMNHDDFDVHDHNDGVDVSVDQRRRIKKRKLNVNSMNFDCC